MHTSGFSFNEFDFTIDRIQAYEYFLALAYLTFIYGFCYLIKFKRYKKSPFKKYIIPAVTVKIIGGIGVCLIYNYYYRGGDTSIFYNEGRILANILLSDPVAGIRLLFSIGGNIAPDLYPYVQSFSYANVENSFLIVKLSALIQLFTFKSFLITSIVFGFLSFWGIWKLFKLFSTLYPSLIKPFAFAFLFTPSVFFWGSGILKDTVCLTSLAILFYCIYNLFIKGENKLSNAIGIIISGYLLVVIKIYIIMAFTLCIISAIFFNYRDRIKSKPMRNFITPIFVFFALLLGFFILKILTENSGAGLYSLDNILATAESTRTYIYQSGGESTYSLGNIDNSIRGLITVIPAGIIVTLFRPFIWESHNLISFLSSLENLAILIITIRVLFQVGIFKFFKITYSNYIAFFCITFSLIFAFSIGVTTYNFGTIVRYKIPCIPFYIAGLYLVHHLYKKQKQEIRLRKSLKQSALGLPN